MSKKICYILFIISLILLAYESKSITLSLYKDPILTSVDTTETMRNLQFNKIYINSKIGSNNKIIKFYLRFNEHITYITDNYYSKDESTTYEFTRKGDYIPTEFQTDDLSSGYESKDILNINNNILNNFNFILVNKLNKDDKQFYYPIFGLNLIGGNNIRPALYNTNILEQLKKNNLIERKNFCILENNKDGGSSDAKGEIIFGELPHENIKKFENFIFDEKNLYWINAEIGEYNLKWKLAFDSISYANNELNSLITELIIEQEVFTAPYEFKRIIHQNFFEELIKNNICKEEKFYNYRESFLYYFYNCDSNLDLNQDKYKNHVLKFKSNSLNEIFSFNLNELFIKNGQKMYFCIIFDEYQMHGWRLGNIFFKKYPLIFSLDNKAIGYYSQNINNIKKPNNKLVYVLFFLVLILLVILFIGIKKYNLLKKLVPRKLLANELLDQYSYNSADNNNINSPNNDTCEATTEMIYQKSENKDNKLGV